MAKGGSFKTFEAVDYEGIVGSVTIEQRGAKPVIKYYFEEQEFELGKDAIKQWELKNPNKGRQMQAQLNQVKLGEALKHFGAGLMALGSSFEVDPTPTTPDAVGSAQATTAAAKKAADKAAKDKAAKDAKNAAAAETESEGAEATETPAPAATTSKKTTTTKKADKAAKPDFENLNRDEKIEHLREKMVEVSVKVGGDRDKVYSFLTKYKAQKVNELSDENLDNLKEDVEVFLTGPDALDI